MSAKRLDHHWRYWDKKVSGHCVEPGCYEPATDFVRCNAHQAQARRTGKARNWSRPRREVA